jgi:tetratricopeptide (TPR) repeat protein
MAIDAKMLHRSGSAPRGVLVALVVLALAPSMATAQSPTDTPAGDAAVRARQAVAALRSDRPDDAIRLYTAALAAENLANDQRALMLIDRGVARARLGQSRTALDDFNRAIQLVPEGATAYNNRGTVLIELGATAEAVRDFDRAILLAPNYAAALTNRAAAHVRLANLRAALTDYSRAIGLLQTDAGAFAGRGRVHLAQGRPYAALRDFGRALSVSPRFGPALRARAEARLALERYKDAIDDLGRVLDIDHDNIEVLLLRGYAAIAAREIPTALADFERAITLDPRSNAALEARGFAEAKDAKYDEALNDLSRALELDPRSAQAYAYRGWVYKLTGRAELGQKDIERAMGLEPDRPEVIWARGELLEVLGRPDEAIVELRRALEMKPMLREAAAALERNGASPIFASQELEDQSVGDWRIQVRGNHYFATNSQYPRLTVPLEMMGDGQPRLLDWTQRTEATQHIGILHFTEGAQRHHGGAGAAGKARSDLDVVGNPTDRRRPRWRQRGLPPGRAGRTRGRATAQAARLSRLAVRRQQPGAELGAVVAERRKLHTAKPPDRQPQQRQRQPETEAENSVRPALQELRNLGADLATRRI